MTAKISLPALLTILILLSMQANSSEKLDIAEVISTGLTHLPVALPTR